MKPNQSWIRKNGAIPRKIRLNLAIRDPMLIRHLRNAQYGQVTAETIRLMRGGLLALGLMTRLERAGQELEALVQGFRADPLHPHEGLVEPPASESEGQQIT